MIRPFILFNEADKKATAKEDSPDLNNDHVDEAEVTAPIDDHNDPMPDAEDDTSSTDDGNTSGEDAGSDDLNDDGLDDNTDDSTASDNTAAAESTFTDVLKKERMFDAIVEIRKQCDILTPSIAFLSTAVKDEKVITIVVKLKKVIQDTSDQCDVICTKFADIGYDNISKLYPVLADRITTVSDVLENVIDSDERFKTPENK